MTPPSRRTLRVAGLAVAVFLLGLAFYPGTFASPYVTAEDSPRYAHAIVPESSSLYEEYTAEYDHEVYRYEELSPVGRELFDRTRAAEPLPQYGGERRFVPDVCRDFVLVCDEYARDELPEQFTYGTELRYEEAFAYVEEGGDRYLLRTGTTGHLFFGPAPVHFVVRWLTVLPLAGLVAAVATRTGDERALGGAAVGGALIATAGLAAPYVEMAGFGSALPIGLVALGGTWIAVLSAGGYGAYRWATAGRSDPSTE